MTQPETPASSGTEVGELGRPIVPEGLRRAGTRAWMWVGISIFAVILVTFLGTLSDLVVPLIIAIVLGMIFEPVVTMLARWIPRKLAAIVVLVALVGLVVASIAVIVIGIIDQGPEIAAQFQAALARLGDWFAEQGIDLEPTAQSAASVEAAVAEALPGILAQLPDLFSSVAGFLGGAFVALFILFFVLADWERYAGWVGAHLDVPADLGAGIVEDATQSMRDYFYVLTLTALPVAILVAITAALLSVPLAFTIGLVTFIFAYIPYIGALLSGVFAVTIAFGSGGLVPAVGIVVAIAIGQGVLEPLLSTRLQREALNLDPVVSFGSTIVGSALAGVLGATLSAPIVGMTLRINQRIKDYKEFGPDYDRAAAEAAAEEEAAKRDAGEAEPSGASQPG
jgi:predicted PurR-regulated permease PerM